MKSDKKKNKNPLAEALQIFESTTKTPNEYLVEQKQYVNKLQKLSKILFDNAQTTNNGQANYMPFELYIDDMDTEQIWQQLEVQNDTLWNDCLSESCRLLSLNEDKYKLKIKYPGEEDDDEKDGEEEEEEEDQLNGDDDEDIEDEEDEDEELGEEEDDEDDEEEEEDEEESSKAKKKTKALKKVKIIPSAVDDQFFKLSEMEAFLDGEDKKEMDRMNGKEPQDDYDSDDEGEEIDYFDSLSTDSEPEDDDGDDDDEEDENVNGKDKEKRLKYADFFDEEDQEEESPEAIRQRRRAEREEKNKLKKSEKNEDLGLEDSEGEDSVDEENENILDDEEEDDDDGDENDEEDEDEIAMREGDDNEEEVDQSEFALRQGRLQNRIEELEENALGDKPWQLKGEITSSTRPKNSLLEEVLEFDSVARPAPLITEQTTECLEDIIKRRIKSKAWDDVQRKFKPANEQQDFRKNLVLNQEKSKESLAQIYEKEFLEKVHKLNNVDDDAKPDEPPEHVAIRKELKDLFTKLDALSNFHFTTKPVAAEPKIVTNLPAIEMEEVAPVSVSDATLLAPEEVRARPIGDEIGKSERTDADKKRERRKKKLKQKLLKERDDKRVEEKEKLGIKVTTKEKQKQLMNQVTKSRNVIKGKDTAINENKALKSSKSFFTQLQDNATTKIKSGKKKSSTDLSASEANAKRFKL